MNKKSIADVDVARKRCLVRVDFNVPMKDGAITDDTRIRGAIPTVSYLLDKGAKVILCSHMGKPHNILDDEIIWDKKTEKALSALPESERPAAAKAAEEKARKDDLKKFGLAPVAARLGELLGKKVEFASDVVGPDAAAKVSACGEGECVLLENLRFHAAEAGRGEDFCRKLAGYCDIYVNDAFGTAHRSHASTAAIAEYGFVKTAVCGFLIEKELRVMGGALENPERPFVAVLGGAKIADKLNVIRNLLDKCDALIVGGGMAYTFCLAAGGYEGHSLVDTDKLDYCREMMDKAKALGKKIYLPADSVAADSFPDPVDAPVDTVVCDSRAIPEGKMGLDIGPLARKQFAEVIASAKTVIWNGPMGVFENPVLSAGTLAVAEAMAGLKDATTIIGGGDSAAAVTQLGLADRMTHISTGGGASLEFFEGKTLPGIACLNDK